MSELKECPFCGSKASVISKEFVACYNHKCGASIDMDAEADALAAWNRRADGWQPIETAPKDTDVLVFTGYIVKVASLVDDFDPDPPKWMDNHGWDLNPICWQPLPPPPTTGETV